jgi:hypothetical protein
LVRATQCVAVSCSGAGGCNVLLHVHAGTRRAHSTCRARMRPTRTHAPGFFDTSVMMK